MTYLSAASTALLAHFYDHLKTSSALLPLIEDIIDHPPSINSNHTRPFLQISSEKAMDRSTEHDYHSSKHEVTLLIHARQRARAPIRQIMAVIEDHVSTLPLQFNGFLFPIVSVTEMEIESGNQSDTLYGRLQLEFFIEHPVI